VCFAAFPEKLAGYTKFYYKTIKADLAISFCTWGGNRTRIVG